MEVELAKSVQLRSLGSAVCTDFSFLTYPREWAAWFFERLFRPARIDCGVLLPLIKRHRRDIFTAVP